MAATPPIATILTERGFPHRLFRHSGRVESLEQAAAERGQTPEQVVRSLLFRVSKHEYVLVLVAGPEQIDWRRLRQHLGQSRISMASTEEVKSVTGYRVGAVGPFGLARPVPVIVERSVSRQAVVSIGSGQRGVAVILTTQHLLSALGNPRPVQLRGGTEA